MVDGETLVMLPLVSDTDNKLFAVLKDFRKEIHIPVILMGYLNPVLQFGFEKSCSERCVLFAMEFLSLYPK
jgi:hypothetical protein